MIILLGGTGYVGTAFRKLFQQNDIPFLSVSRKDLDYYSKPNLRAIIEKSSASFLINAAGYTGKPNVDACEVHKAECLLGNAVLPGIIREVCTELELPWGHVSSGCIYTGSRPDGTGFSESDPPNFSFRSNNCSFYSGCKAIGEECLENSPRTYIWRLRIPFNHEDSPRNYISKVLTYDRLLEATNSISHLDEFVNACYQCFVLQVPYGTYNITNPGVVTTSEIVQTAKRVLRLQKNFRFFENEREFMQTAAKTPRSNCVLDSRKILSYGIKLTPAITAIEQSLMNWQKQ